MKSFYIKTFGCQMNDHDSERIGEILKSKDFVVASSPEKADLILLNTCSIREKSLHKVYSLLGRVKHLKKKNSDLIIGVCGCVAEQEKENILKKAPYVDLVFGTHMIHKLPSIIDDMYKKREKIVCTGFFKQGFHFVDFDKKHADFLVSRYVTIINGCSNFCSYCIVPYVRGPEISRLADDIIEEINNMVEKGTREVTLIGQNVNSYGRDLKPEVKYDELINKVHDINGLDRIRFTTSHPKDISKELIDCFGSLPKLCEHIHLPVQSGSDSVLANMNRKYTLEDYLGIIRRIRGVRPDIAITTDLIVGFPCETDRDFEKTLDLVKEVRFDNFFSFIYSPRPGTKASLLKDDVSLEDKKKRLALLQKQGAVITEEIDKTYFGKTCEVLVEGYSKNSKDKLSGRTRTNKVVNFMGDKSLIGKMVNIEIDKVFSHSLGGRIVK